MLTGFITTGLGEGSCASPQGVVNRTNLRLIVDGRPIEPLLAPNQALFEEQSLPLRIAFPIPVDAQELAIKAIGRGDSTFESAFTLPELPVVPGE